MSRVGTILYCVYYTYDAIGFDIIDKCFGNMHAVKHTTLIIYKVHCYLVLYNYCCQYDLWIFIVLYEMKWA